MQQVWRTCLHILRILSGWCYRDVSLPCWKVFAGAFKRPSFGNGEAPLWSVAVRVSGRFNLSCHRINFHVGENQDCSSKVCISCERVRPKPPCLPWCMQKLGPCTLVHYGVFACIAWACDLLIVVYSEMLCAQIGWHAMTWRTFCEDILILRHPVGGLEHEFHFSIYLGIMIPTDFHIFRRGGSTTNQDIVPTFGWQHLFRMCPNRAAFGQEPANQVPSGYD